jgi:probable phosphoglycerate mutase
VLTILLTRHGHTDLSEPDRYLGRRIPAPLSEKGRRAAQALGDRLKSVQIDRVISSPLERAQETARLIVAGRNLAVETDERMIEFDYGGWEGMTTDEVSDRLHDQYELYDANPAIYRPGGGENGNRAAERALALIEYLLDWWGGDGDRTVLLVGHSSINRVLLAAITDVPIADYRRRFLQDWANLTVLRWHDRDSGPLMVLVNDVAHIRGLEGDTWS